MEFGFHIAAKAEGASRVRLHEWLPCSMWLAERVRSKLHCSRFWEHAPPKKVSNLDLLSMFLRQSETTITVHNLHSLVNK